MGSHTTMPVIFVHGVNTRIAEAGYSARIGLIDRFVRKHLARVMLDGAEVTSLAPAFPYWGDIATTFAWNMASLPTGNVEALGPAIDDRLAR
jgi:hypothetical protein